MQKEMIRLNLVSKVKNKQNDFLNKLRNIATDKKNYRTKRNYS